MKPIITPEEFIVLSGVLYATSDRFSKDIIKAILPTFAIVGFLVTPKKNLPKMLRGLK